MSRPSDHASDVPVVVLRDDHLGYPRSGGRGGGAAREERLLVDLADGYAVGLVVQQGQLGLSPGDDCAAAERSGLLDHRLAQTFGRTDAAEAEVHGWLAGIEERSTSPGTDAGLGGSKRPSEAHPGPRSAGRPAARSAR
jgi:hypothetical protein